MFRFMFLILVFIPMFISCLITGAWAGSGPPAPLLINQTDTGANRLIYYWDTRERRTFFHLANISDSEVVVHIQIFHVNAPALSCEEVDWDDVFTPNDSHLYDIENLTSNCIVDDINNNSCDFAPNPDYRDGYGFIAVSLISGDSNSLIGSFRIIDDDGYEYRANAAAPNDDSAGLSISNGINFSEAGGANLSDVVGIAFLEVDFDTVLASPNIEAKFGGISGDPFQSLTPQIFIIDEFEDPTSCSPSFFSCSDPNFNRGIDNSIPSTKQANLGNRICNDSTLTESNKAGWLLMPFIEFVCSDHNQQTVECNGEPFFVGFIGVNDGQGRGSMDSWTSVQLDDNL